MCVCLCVFPCILEWVDGCRMHSAGGARLNFCWHNLVMMKCSLGFDMAPRVVCQGSCRQAKGGSVTETKPPACPHRPAEGSRPFACFHVMLWDPCIRVDLLALVCECVLEK